MNTYNVNLTEQELINNYNELLSYVEMFQSPRKEQVLKMYEDLQDQIIIASAASMKQFHGCYPGGYVLHVLNVIKFSAQLYNLWKKMGANVDNYTHEELLFAAMFHDLGKIGDKNIEFYTENTDNWSREKQGKLYIQNPNLHHMPHEERSLFLLQKYGISITENEYIGIRTHNGPFMESNKEYWNLNFDKSREFKTNLPIIIHYADFMAYRIEVEKEGIIKPE